jgi:hypothetical protein
MVKKVWFKLDEFKILLKSELHFCHELLSYVLTIREDMRFPALAYIKKNTQISAKGNLMKFLLKLQKGGKPSIEEDFTVEVKDLKQNEERNKKLEKLINPNIKSEVDILTVPFKYDYSKGSEDSVRFLSYYSKSNCDAFITSEWKQLIDQKWLSVKIFNFFLATYFFAFLIVSTIVLVFEEGKKEYAYTLIFIIIFFIVLECIQIMSYVGFDLKAYFKDIWNLIDWTLFTLTLIYPSTLQNETHKAGPTNRVGGVLIILLIYYRGFSYLRIFESFTSYVEIINSVISKFFI